MKSKRIITLITAVVFMFGLFVLPSAAAVDPDVAKLIVVGGEVNVEGTIVVDVKAEADLSIFRLKLEYDEELLTYKDIDVVADYASLKEANDGYVVVICENMMGKVYDNASLFKVTFEALDVDAFKAKAGGQATLDALFTLAPEQDMTAKGLVNVLRNSQAVPYEDDSINYDGIGKVTISIPAAAPEIEGAVTISNTSPKIGDKLTANYKVTDVNGDNENTTAETVEWLVGDAKTGTKTTKTGEYTVTKEDYGKTIVAKVTPTVDAEPKTGAPVSSAATTAVAANPAYVATVSNLAFTPTTFNVTIPVTLSYEIESDNGYDEDESTIVWTYEDGSAVPAANVSADGKTYTPSMEDFNEDKKIKATVTPKGDRDTNAGTADEIVSESTVVAGPMKPVVSDVKVLKDGEEVTTALVGETLTVTYEWFDANEDTDGDEDISEFQWNRDGEAIEGAVEEEYTLTAADRDAKITVTVLAKSTGSDPNPHTEEDDTSTGDPVTSAEVEILKNPELLPKAEDINFDKYARINAVAKVTYKFTDENGFAEAEEGATFKFELADSDGESAIWTLIEESDENVVISDNTIKVIGNDYLDKFIRAIIIVKNEDGMEGTYYSEAAEVVRAPKGGGSVGGGPTLEPVYPTASPSPTPDKTTDPSKGIAKFTDVPASTYSWAVEGIDALVKAEAIVGRTETTFDPEGRLTRAEFTAIVIRALDLIDDEAKATFEDVSTNHWGYAEIASAEELGILGFFGDTFDPDSIITRDEMAAVAYNAALAAEITLSETATAEEFDDAASIGEYAVEAIEALQKSDILHGMGDGTFAPKGELTRAQGAKVAYLVFKLK